MVQRCSERWLKGRKCCESVQHPRSPLWKSSVPLSNGSIWGTPAPAASATLCQAPTTPCGTWDPALARVVPAPLCLHKAPPQTSSATHLCQPTPGTTVPPQRGNRAGGDTAEQGGVTLCHTPLHTYIFSMSSFSSKAPGRSRLFPRTRTCRAGQGTLKAPGHQTWQEPASATQQSLAVTSDSPGYSTRMSQTEKLPSAALRRQSTSINCIN